MTLLEEEAWEYYGQNYGIWTCDDYSEVGSMSPGDFQFDGTYWSQPKGDTGHASVRVQNREDGFYIQITLNRGDYDQLNWYGFIDQGNFNLIPR